MLLANLAGHTTGLGLRPLPHRFSPKLPHLFDEQGFKFIGRAGRFLLATGQTHNGHDPLLELRVLVQRLQELLVGFLIYFAGFLLHPQLNA